MAQAKKSNDIETKDSKAKQLKHAEVVAETVPAVSAPKADIEIEKPAAKAGKRSVKSQKEAEEKAAKSSRQPENKKVAEKKVANKPSSSKLESAGKKYKQAAKLIEKHKAYPLAEAMDLAIKTATTKFDSSVEMHINLGVDPRQADQNVRDSIVLPAGSGKAVRIAVLAEGDEAAKAKSAGADIANIDEIFANLDKEYINYDVLIASPALMPRLGKYARLLGPRGLMPNPKSGTVSQDPAKAVAEAKAGRVEYRVDQAGIIHLTIGKASFGGQKLTRNAEAVLASVKAAKPASLKGIYIKSTYVTSTMGPSIKIES